MLHLKSNEPNIKRSKRSLSPVNESEENHEDEKPMKKITVFNSKGEIKTRSGTNEELVKVLKMYMKTGKTIDMLSTIYCMYLIDSKINFIHSGISPAMVNEIRNMKENPILYFTLKRNLDKIIQLHNRGVKWDSDSTAAAVKINDLDILQYLVFNGCPITVTASRTAALYGNLEMLKYLYSIRGYFRREYSKSIEGEIEEVGYMFPFDESVFAAAAGSGHYNCLLYLHDIGCPWDETVSSAAALGGHILCLDYLLENGCPLDENITKKSREIFNYFN